jgi:hypothetical protein
MPERNGHRVWIGPTDDEGRVVVARDWLFDEARKEMNFFVMDYSDPSRTSGEFTVTAANLGDIERAIAAYPTFEPHFHFRPGWLEDLETAKRALGGRGDVTATLE